MLSYSARYGRIVLLGLVGFILQMFFSSFFVTAEKSQLGFYVTVASGVKNMVLDAVIVGLIRWGLEGAAATAISQILVAEQLLYISFLLTVASFVYRKRTMMGKRFCGHARMVPQSFWEVFLCLL